MPGQQLIMQKITKIAGRNYVYIFPTKSYYNMKNDAQLNPIIADFKRIDIILVIYKALYFPYPPQKHDFRFSAIFSVLFAFLSPSSRSLIQFLYFSVITDD